MSDMILDITMLPEAPIVDEQKSFDCLIGMFADGKLSIDYHLKQKQLDKKME